MNEKVLVGGSLRTWWLYFPILVFAACTGLSIYLGQTDTTGSVLLIAGCVSAVLAILAAVILFLRRRWLEITTEGFALSGPMSGESTHRDDDVTGLRSYFFQRFSSGILKGQTWHLTVWLPQPGGEERQYHMALYSNIEEENALDTLGTRLNQNLYERTRAGIDSGGVLAGDDWEFSSRGLMIKTGSGYQEPVAFSQISAYGDYDDRLCIWRQGEEEPVVRLGAESRNLDVLRTLLSEFVPEPDESTENLQDGLGRVLFRRDISYWYLWLLGPASIGLAYIVFDGAGQAGRPYVMHGIAAFFAGLGLLFLYMAWCSRKARFSCHELGVRDIGIFARRELLYDQIATFTYSAVRHFTNGVYQGTQLEMTFQPLPELAAEIIQYSAMVDGDDDALDNLRDAISDILAIRMGAVFAETGNVDWLSNLAFQAEGLEYHPRGLLYGTKEPIFIPYSEITGWTIETGSFLLYRDGNDGAVIQEDFDQPNFFPGMLLLGRLLSPEEEDDEDEEDE